MLKKVNITLLLVCTHYTLEPTRSWLSLYFPLLWKFDFSLIIMCCPQRSPQSPTSDTSATDRCLTE